jgi:hypothetical protein
MFSFSFHYWYAATLNRSSINRHSTRIRFCSSSRQTQLNHPHSLYLHPALARVSTPVTGFVPCNVGFLHKDRLSKSPMYASEKSVFSKLLSSKLVPVKTVLTNKAPRNEDPRKLARSTDKRKAIYIRERRTRIADARS